MNGKQKKYFNIQYTHFKNATAIMFYALMGDKKLFSIFFINTKTHFFMWLFNCIFTLPHLYMGGLADILRNLIDNRWVKKTAPTGLYIWPLMLKKIWCMNIAKFTWCRIIVFTLDMLISTIMTMIQHALKALNRNLSFKICKVTKDYIDLFQLF